MSESSEIGRRGDPPAPYAPGTDATGGVADERDPEFEALVESWANLSKLLRPCSADFREQVLAAGIKRRIEGRRSRRRKLAALAALLIVAAVFAWRFVSRSELDADRRPPSRPSRFVVWEDELDREFTWTR